MGRSNGKTTESAEISTGQRGSRPSSVTGDTQHKMRERIQRKSDLAPTRSGSLLQEMVGRSGELATADHTTLRPFSLEPVSEIQRAVQTNALSKPTYQPTHQPLHHNVIARLPAPWPVRRAWLSFFDHYLPRKFLNHYMDDTTDLKDKGPQGQTIGTPIILTQQEMIDCNPRINIRRDKKTFRKALVALRNKSTASSQAIKGKVAGGAMTNGTLGNFTVKYEGVLEVEVDKSWRFTGKMSFYDFWDFDPKPFYSKSRRPTFAEIRVRAAAYGLPGKPFKIHSVDVPFTQLSGHKTITWVGGTPQHIVGPMMRTAMDVGSGFDVGTVGSADVVVGDVGGDAGAQSSEDVNTSDGETN